MKTQDLYLSFSLLYSRYTNNLEASYVPGWRTYLHLCDREGQAKLEKIEKELDRLWVLAYQRKSVTLVEFQLQCTLLESFCLSLFDRIRGTFPPPPEDADTHDKLKAYQEQIGQIHACAWCDWVASIIKTKQPKKETASQIPERIFAEGW